MPEPLTPEELAAEAGTPLPTKEVMSLLDLNANIDLGLDLAAPVDLAVAANLNVAAPIDAAASANVLSVGSDATAAAPQATSIAQHVAGTADATAPQSADVAQGTDGSALAPDDGGGTSTSIGDLTSGGNLLDVNVDVDAQADLAAPVAGAVAANANVAAPIDAAVAANVGSVDSTATAYAPQTAIIDQDLDGVTASALADQDAHGVPIGGEMRTGDDVPVLLESWIRQSTGDLMWLRPDQWRLPAGSAMDVAVTEHLRNGRRSRAIYPARALEEAPQVIFQRASAGEEVRIIAEVPSRMAIIAPPPRI